MPGRSTNRLDELLCRLADGLLAEGEGAELDQILRESPEAREQYRVFSATHLMLASGHYESVESPLTPIPQRSFLPLAAAAAALALLATGTAIWQSRGREQTTPAARNELEKPVLAVVAYAENARWNLEDSAAGGMKLRATPVTLNSGILVLDLIGGQTVTLRAPARFELIGEREMSLTLGDASLRMHDNRVPYIIRVPGGAVVDLGTEFSVNVASNGTSDVHVFEGLANASVTGASGSTREEQLLSAGQSVRVSETLEKCPATPSDFIRPLPMEVREPSPAGDAYAKAITRSAPVIWWNFEGQIKKSSIPPTAGNQPLTLHNNALLAGPEGGRFFFTDGGSHAGFAIAEQPIQGLDTPAGVTYECLVYPLSEQQATALAFDEPALSLPAETRRANAKHPPHRLAIERMGLQGSFIGHAHPDFAMRVLMRSPAGYEGGTNVYSTESHLLHRWIHVACTHDGQTLCLYLDGKLSEKTKSKLPFQNAILRPIVARLHALPTGKNRQWHGGIDEVAVYNRVLDPTEIRSHADTLDR